MVTNFYDNDARLLATKNIITELNVNDIVCLNNRMYRVRIKELDLNESIEQLNIYLTKIKLWKKK